MIETVISDTPQVGSFVRLDGRTFGENLLPCDDWDKAEFRWPNPIREWRESRAIAINVEVTGRVIQWKDGGGWLRVKVTFVGDGEPDQIVRGYMRVR